MVTSSAVVGSSAMTSAGLQASAMAISTRCRMPARQLMRVAAHPGAALGIRTDSSSATARSVRIAPCRRAVDEQRFGDLIADREHRIQRRHRLLKDERDLGPAHGAHVALREGQQVAALETDAASCNAARRLHQPQDRHRGDRFAAAGFADQPQRLSGPHLEAHVVYRRRRADGRSKTVVRCETSSIDAARSPRVRRTPAAWRRRSRRPWLPPRRLHDRLNQVASERAAADTASSDSTPGAGVAPRAQRAESLDLAVARCRHRRGRRRLSRPAARPRHARSG